MPFEKFVKRAYKLLNPLGGLHFIFLAYGWLKTRRWILDYYSKGLNLEVPKFQGLN